MQDKIIETARMLFNQQGIGTTSLRHIAQQLGISDGHLRYYFQTKEALILATFQQMDQRIEALADGVFPPTVQTILGSLSQSFGVMQQYGYFFTESPALLAQYPQVTSAYKQLIASRQSLFLGVFERFQQEGVFRKEVDAVLFPVLFEQFFIISDNWVKYARLRQAANPEGDQIAHYVGVCVALFLPYFNEEIKQQVLDWIKRSL